MGIIHSKKSVDIASGPVKSAAMVDKTTEVKVTELPQDGDVKKEVVKEVETEQTEKLEEQTKVNGEVKTQENNTEEKTDECKEKSENGEIKDHEKEKESAKEEGEKEPQEEKKKEKKKKKKSFRSFSFLRREKKVKQQEETNGDVNKDKDDEVKAEEKSEAKEEAAPVVSEDATEEKKEAAAAPTEATPVESKAKEAEAEKGLADHPSNETTSLKSDSSKDFGSESTIPVHEASQNLDCTKGQSEDSHDASFEFVPSPEEKEFNLDPEKVPDSVTEETQTCIDNSKCESVEQTSTFPTKIEQTESVSQNLPASTPQKTEIQPDEVITLEKAPEQFTAEVQVVIDKVDLPDEVSVSADKSEQIESPMQELASQIPAVSVLEKDEVHSHAEVSLETLSKSVPEDVQVPIDNPVEVSEQCNTLPDKEISEEMKLPLSESVPQNSPIIIEAEIKNIPSGNKELMNMPNTVIKETSENVVTESTHKLELKLECNKESEKEVVQQEATTVTETTRVQDVSVTMDAATSDEFQTLPKLVPEDETKESAISQTEVSDVLTDSNPVPVKEIVLEVSDVTAEVVSPAIEEMIPEAVSIPSSELVPEVMAAPVSGSVVEQVPAPLVEANVSIPNGTLENENAQVELPTPAPPPVREVFVTEVSPKVEVGIITRTESAKCSHNEVPIHDSDNSEFQKKTEDAVEKSEEKAESKIEEKEEDSEEKKDKTTEKENTPVEEETPSKAEAAADNAIESPALVDKEIKETEEEPKKASEAVSEQTQVLASEKTEESVTAEE